jgi:hypothetical protein
MNQPAFHPTPAGNRQKVGKRNTRPMLEIISSRGPDPWRRPTGGTKDPAIDQDADGDFTAPFCRSDIWSTCPSLPRRLQNASSSMKTTCVSPTARLLPWASRLKRYLSIDITDCPPRGGEHSDPQLMRRQRLVPIQYLVFFEYFQQRFYRNRSKSAVRTFHRGCFQYRVVNRFFCRLHRRGEQW